MTPRAAVAAPAVSSLRRRDVTRRASALHAAWVVTLIGITVGCASKPAPRKAATGAGPDAPRVNAPANDARATAPDEDKLPPDLLGVIDPCAMRLEDIAGALLEYYRRNQELPETLPEAQATSPGGLKLAFTCPISRQPYRYAPRGLQSLGRNKRLVVYDPTPAHDNKRWCILFSSSRPGQPPYLEVFQLTEQAFETYMPIAEHRDGK